MATIALERKPAYTEAEVSRLLLELGCRPQNLGFHYAKTALKLMAESGPDYYAKIGITKGLYPDIAKIHGTTYSRVERAIRHEVDHLFEAGNIDKLHEIFLNYSYSKGKATNSEFLAQIYEYLTVRRNPSHE